MGLMIYFFKKLGGRYVVICFIKKKYIYNLKREKSREESPNPEKICKKQHSVRAVHILPILLTTESLSPLPEPGPTWATGNCCGMNERTKRRTRDAVPRPPTLSLIPLLLHSMLKCRSVGRRASWTFHFCSGLGHNAMAWQIDGLVI